MVELWLWKTAWQKKMECWKHWWRKLLKVKGDTLLNWRDFLLQKLHSFGEALNLRGAIHGPLFPLLMVGRVVIQQDSIKSLPWATSIYLVATWKYQTNLCKKLGNCTRSKQWWSLLLSLVGRSYRGQPTVPPAHHLASYFSYKLSCSSTLDEPPTLEEYHHLTFREFQIKKSQVKSVLQSLNVTNPWEMTGWAQEF